MLATKRSNRLKDKVEQNLTDRTLKLKQTNLTQTDNYLTINFTITKQK